MLNKLKEKLASFNPKALVSLAILCMFGIFVSVADLIYNTLLLGIILGDDISFIDTTGSAFLIFVLGYLIILIATVFRKNRTQV